MNRIIIYILVTLISSLYLNGNVLFDEPINLTQINTEYNEFAPSWNNYDERLYLTSDKSGNEKLYVSQFNIEQVLSEPKFLNSPINTAHKNLSFISFLSPEKAYFSTYTFK